MRFFLEFVSCCGSPTKNKSEPTTLPAEDEQRWLVPAPPLIASRPRRKRGKRGHEWRPSLGSISEDITVSTRQRTDPRNDAAAAVSTARDVKRRSDGGGGPGAKARQRSYDGDYGGAAMPTIMPAFSATPFMF